jgi:hypothetical protein
VLGLSTSLLEQLIMLSMFWQLGLLGCCAAAAVCDEGEAVGLLQAVRSHVQHIICHVAEV